MTGNTQARLILYSFAIVTIIVIILAAKQPRRASMQEVCQRDGGTWVVRYEMQVTTIWDGYSYVPMTTWVPEGHCEIKSRN